ncbi:Uncharacterised protein [Escherichia coli]|uniref:Uncharacterized protein n=1 Tax=Escherichia coli TaxID=562 RepID=A0A377HIX0_ECOLX|nr:Uncharacterised protein [Escherichia coli]
MTGQVIAGAIVELCGNALTLRLIRWYKFTTPLHG